jgi:poly-gamma-glutamate synthesis protein (capsule biosynthesis protein)
VGELSVLLSGDALITRPYEPRADQHLLALLQSADVRFSNFEMLINDYGGTPAVEAGGLHLSAPAAIGRDLMETGFNLFATANNHSLDFGTDGLLAHIEAMRSLGMQYAGVGTALGEAAEPVYLDTCNGRVAMISCASSFAPSQRAGERRSDFAGRPGLNPLRHKTTIRLSQEHYGWAQAINEGTGIAAINRWLEEMEFRPPPDDPENQKYFLGRSLLEGTIFERGEKTEIVTKPHEGDLKRITAQIEHARRQADLVIVSIHAHEADIQIEKPAAFIREFGRACIDAGAAVVTGSGPHIMRGIEIYDGKPIFYSLGNLWFEFETVNRLPADSYEMWRVDTQTSTPADLYDKGLLGFHKDVRYWECALPVCRFNAGGLESIDLHCMSLGFGEPRGRRGTPRESTFEDAERIIGYVADLSSPFDTEVTFSDGVGRVRL